MKVNIYENKYNIGSASSKRQTIEKKITSEKVPNTDIIKINKRKKNEINQNKQNIDIDSNNNENNLCPTISQENGAQENNQNSNDSKNIENNHYPINSQTHENINENEFTKCQKAIIFTIVIGILISIILIILIVKNYKYNKNNDNNKLNDIIVNNDNDRKNENNQKSNENFESNNPEENPEENKNNEKSGNKVMIDNEKKAKIKSIFETNFNISSKINSLSQVIMKLNQTIISKKIILLLIIIFYNLYQNMKF